MSTIRLCIIKGNTLYTQECPYRIALKVLNSSQTTQNRFLRLVKQKHYLDAGYILLDLDKQLIVNNQLAFTLNDLSRKKQDELFEYRIVEQF